MNTSISKARDAAYEGNMDALLDLYTIHPARSPVSTLVVGYLSEMVGNLSEDRRSAPTVREGLARVQAYLRDLPVEEDDDDGRVVFLEARWMWPGAVSIYIVREDLDGGYRTVDEDFLLWKPETNEFGHFSHPGQRYQCDDIDAGAVALVAGFGWVALDALIASVRVKWRRTTDVNIWIENLERTYRAQIATAPTQPSLFNQEAA